MKKSPRAGTLRTGATGLEPATSGVTGRRSNQLNYAPAREAERLYLRLAALNDLAVGISRRIVFRQGITRPLTRLPGGDRRLARALRDEARTLDQLVVVDIARA